MSNDNIHVIMKRSFYDRSVNEWPFADRDCILLQSISETYLSVKMKSENLLKKDHGPLGWGEDDHSGTISGPGLVTI